MSWYYEFPRAAPRPKPKAGKERKKFGQTWWGKKWVDILSEYESDQRMSRGRAYARADKVKNFALKEGKITARVEGSSGNYTVNIAFKKYNDNEWEEIIKKLSETPVLLGNLLNNEMPEKIEEITGYSFVPDSFDSECSCPDNANPCKHIAAVFYTLADEIDYDPMSLFKLRGMDKQEILTRLGVIDESEQAELAESSERKSIKQSKRKKRVKEAKARKEKGKKSRKK